MGTKQQVQLRLNMKASDLPRWDLSKAFYKGMATGSATALSEWLATKEEVLELLREMDN